ncbi:MAG: hypothetical protein LJF04_07130 [Gemmatimonadetes bacterium]|nr:hypothetical protein [Gemmatimonadota bacterium]
MTTMDRTFLIVLLSVFAVAGGMWDLFKRNGRDLLGSFLLLGLGMVAGVGLESLFGGGFLVGTIAGFAVGMPRLVRAEKRRKDAMASMLLEAPDTASALLVVHDRLDELERCSPQGRLGRTAWFVGLTLMALVGFGELAIGLSYHVWQFLLAGSCLLFLPVSQIGRTMVEAEESHVLRGVLRRLHAGGVDAADALARGGSEGAEPMRAGDARQRVRPEGAPVSSATNNPPAADPPDPMQPA